MRACVAVAVALLGSVGALPANALTKMEQSLMKLDPEERAHQACVAKGLDVVRRDKRLAHADRLMPDVFKRAHFTEGMVKAPGAAVRSDSHWYALSFECALTDDQLKATSFTFKVGDEIPPGRWDDVGLWR
jgi:hypothetical protein